MRLHLQLKMVIMFKRWSYLETLKLRWLKMKMVKNFLHLEITEVVLSHCNILNNDYQHDSRVLCAFVPNKSFGQLLNISPNFF